VVLFSIGLVLTCLPGLLVTYWMTKTYHWLIRNYLQYLLRIFQEKPVFIIPRGQSLPQAEDVHFPTSNGLTLRGCYLKARGPRRGVILFGLEFGANRWSCWGYCEHLVEAGFDIFAFETRNQGESDCLPGYEPLQWLTDYEVQDTQAALKYLKGRPDADPRGVGFFGISKGGNAGLLAASLDPYIRCCVTDGAFATYSTMVPYLRQWFRIYNRRHAIHDLIPDWYFGKIGRVGLRQIEQLRNCRFPDLERFLKRLAPRPLLMIHGEADTYIRPEMAQALFRYARKPCEFWLVKDAKHNQALLIDGAEYRARVLQFFERHLLVSRDAEPRSGARLAPALRCSAALRSASRLTGP
jgi:pimeloyl-ACP methyl ester carboxylesterase